MHAMAVGSVYACVCSMHPLGICDGDYSPNLYLSIIQIIIICLTPIPVENETAAM